MNLFKKRFLNRVILLIFFLFLTFIIVGSNCLAAPENLKIQKIALLNPDPTKKSNPKVTKFLNLYFKKYAQARPQAMLIPFTPDKRTVSLEELKTQGFNLAVIPILKGKKAVLEIYELYQNRRLWSLANELDSDMELLFWILDRSIIAGIKMAPDKIRLGLAPGKNGDLPGKFPCRDIYYNLKQLTNFQIEQVPIDTYNSYQNHPDDLSAKMNLDYYLFYQSNEFDMTKPLVTGAVLNYDRSIYSEFAVRIETNKIGSVKANVHQEAVPSGPGPSSGPTNPTPPPDTGVPLYNFVETNYLVSVAQELSNYFIAVLLTDFCRPQETPLKIKLTKLRKYIKGEASPFPQLDNTQPSETLIRFKLN